MSTHSAPGKIQKLPKWAQQHINYLERLAGELETRIEELRGERPGAVAFREEGVHEWIPVAWPHDTITFTVKDSRRYGLRIAARENGIEVMGESAIRVIPSASNVVRVEVAR